MTSRASVALMNAPLRKPWTQEEFFAWAEGQEGRYEFDGFQPVAMTGGSLAHSAIGGNVYFALKSRLKNGPCRPFNSDAGVATTGDTVRYPDALVTCSPVDFKSRSTPGVVVVFEVLSPSTTGTDCIDKVIEYAAVSSIKRYIILQSMSVGLQVLERSSPEQAWQTTALTAKDILRMPEIGIEIPVAEIYDEVVFDTVDEQAG